MKRTLRRGEFARACGVTPMAITKGCLTFLKPAVVGNRIYIDHPAAVEYQKLKLAGGTVKPQKKVDPLQGRAVEIMQQEKKYTAYLLRARLGVHHGRGQKIIKAAIDAGDIPPKKTPRSGGKRVPPPPPLIKPVATDGEQSTQEGIIQIPEDIKAFLDYSLRDLFGQFGSAHSFNDWLIATAKIEGINEKRLKNAKTEGELVARELVQAGIIGPIEGVFVRMLTDGAKTIASRAHSIAMSGGEVDDVRRLVEDQLGSFIEPAKVKMGRALRSV